jgi:adenosylcobyric acid synthase
VPTRPFDLSDEQQVSALMIQGVSSSAGKSLVTTALAHAFFRRGVDVVPFKGQNMSNNARVVQGGEIGTAQYLQALAAGIEPDVRMNPVLVKPEGDNQSQVVVLGRVDRRLSALPWRQRQGLWPAVSQSLHALLAEHQLVLIEGAGSPAEINLRDTDLANMRVAKEAEAAVVLVADIDRGGAFAHLYGTWALLPPEERALICGFILNKFRGDATLLAPAPERLQELTAVPTLGVLPWLAHQLPDEDGVSTPPARLQAPTVAIVRYPTASNLDEFKQLEQVVDLRFASLPADINGVDLLVLPGSKHVAADLAWLRSSGLADALHSHVARGGRLLAICGGLQMLGETLTDRGGGDGDALALGLLPLATRFLSTKQTRPTATRFLQLPEPWRELSGLTFEGYQIRHGRSEPTGSVDAALPDGLGYVSGPILAVYPHGLFEQPHLVEALVAGTPRCSLDEVFNALADAVEAHLDIPSLLDKAGVS